MVIWVAVLPRDDPLTKVMTNFWRAVYIFCFSVICCRFYKCMSRNSWAGLLLLSSLVMCANNRVHYGLLVLFVCLQITLPYYHHCVDLSEGIELITCLAGTFCPEFWDCVYSAYPLYLLQLINTSTIDVITLNRQNIEILVQAYPPCHGFNSP